MKNRIFEYSFLGLLGVLLLVSCYRDKGNYSYKELNEISIDLPDVVSVQQGMVLEISPKLNFALEENEENLSYEWVVSIPSTTDSVNVVLSTDRNFSERIDYVSGNSYPFSLKVTDGNTGVTYRKGMSLQVRTDYQPGYFVVEQMGDHGDISFYNTLTETAYYNIFSKVNPEITLKANITDMFSIDYSGYTLSLGDEKIKVVAGNLSMVFGEDWGYVIDYRSCRMISDIEQIFATKPDAIRPQYLAMDATPNFFLMNDGKVHRMYQSEGQTLFGEEFVTSDGLVADCAPFIGPGFNYRGVMGVMFFDQENHRLYGENMRSLIFSNNSSKYIVQEKNDKGEVIQSDTVLNGAKINEDWEMIGMPQGGMMGASYFMIFKAPENVYVAHYSIPSGGFANGPLNLVDAEKCPGMENSPVFVSPKGRNQVYYANGNEIRLYDVYANDSRVIYTFPSGEEIASILLPTSDGLTMAVATNNGTQGTLYTFTLVNTGDLKDLQPTAHVTGFGKIKKIVYKQ